MLNGSDLGDIRRGPLGEPVSEGRADVQAMPRRLRVVVGVDPDESTASVIETLRMLGGHGLELHFVYVLESGTGLGKARVELETAGLGGTWISSGPNPSHGLIEAARNQSADLIAIGAPRSGEGKVAKALLAHSPVSLLIAKDSPKHPDGLGALLATDHTDYMNACIDRLLSLRLSGLRELVVFTANEIIGGTAAMLVNGLPQFASKAETWVTERIQQENAQIAARFAPYCGSVQASAKAGSPKAAIEEALAQYDTDLLILGAEPRCFLDRLLFGSVAFDEIVFGRRSVLALRP
ncbi:MAG: universal stress protein [Fimbriimonas sp.]